MITVTTKATEKIKEMALLDNKDPILRVAVQGGGCSGFEYALTFSEERDGDTISAQGGIVILIDPMSYMYLDGVEIDWVESLEGSGFKINNPNTTGQCGCGHSFEV